MYFNIKEIFFSYQGEGKYIGSPTIFVRFAGCNLSCWYCDTNNARKSSSGQKLYLNSIVEKIENLIYKHNPEFISFTGGEPLLTNNLKTLVLSLLKYKIKLYLETNSSLPEQLNKIIKYIDVICLNLKLQEDIGKNSDYLKKFKRCINLCKKNKSEFFIKLVISGKEYSQETFTNVSRLVKKSNSEFLVLQPETSSFKNKVLSQKMFFNIKTFYQLLKDKIKYLHIIPQLHRTLWQIR